MWSGIIETITADHIRIYQEVSQDLLFCFYLF